ncbi:MAG: alpha/beta hydrolase [Deltaproteobacteria bacterium]|nr:MAG: alpha/beta hydrolase [Deltaproteobacteria bacterium]
MDERVPTQRVSRDVTARGVRMRVAEAGGEGQAPLILIHDFLVSHLDFDDIIDELAVDFHVISPVLPGFGDSEKPNPSRYSYGVETFAEAIADLIAAYGMGRACVLGHGLGGAVAITLAARYAELVTRLVVLDPLCYPHPLVRKLRVPLWPVMGGMLFKQLYGRGLFRRYFRDDVLSPGAVMPHARIDRFYDCFNAPSARESAHAVLRSMLDTRPVVARIARIRRPTLVVWGREDRMVPATFALKLSRDVPGARLTLMDTGHAPHVERPEELVSVVSEFFAGKRG